MPVIQHIWEFLLFLVILFGPVPLCLRLILTNDSKQVAVGFARNSLILLTSWCIVETSLGLLLGAVRSFNLTALLLVELALFAIGAVLLATQYQRSVQPVFHEQLIPKFFLNPNEVIILGAISFSGSVLLERLVTQPIVNFDSLAYHLPAMARWYQVGFFEVLEQYKSGVGWYPYSWEVLCGLFLFPFREDYLVTLPNIVAWLILGLSTYLLSRNAGAARIHSLAAACLVLNMPLLLQHINTIHIDLPFAAFLITGSYFAITYYQNRSVIDFVLFLTSLGLFFGIKTSALPYGFILIAIIGVLEIRASSFRREPLNFAKHYPFLATRLTTTLSLVGILIFLFLGSFWYVKNYLATGNPLGFVKIQMGDTVIFPGTLTTAEVNRNSLAKIFNPFNLTHWVILLGRAVFWLQIPFLLLFLQSLRLPFALAKSRPSGYRSGLVIVLALLLATGGLYWNTPYSAASSGVASELTTWQSSLFDLKLSAFFGKALRFAFPFLATLGIVAAISATLTDVKGRTVAGLVLFSTIFCTVETTIIEGFFRNSFQTGGGTVETIVDALKISPFQGVSTFVGLLVANANLIFTLLGLVAVLALTWVIVWQVDALRSWVPIAALLIRSHARSLLIAACVVLIFTASYVAREKRELNRQQVYGGIYEFLATNLCPNEVIGYSDSYRSYLFYGKDFSRSVVYEEIKDTSTVESWLKGLQPDNVSVFAIGPAPSEKDWKRARHSQWFDTPNSPFVRIFGDKPWINSGLFRLKNQPTPIANCQNQTPS